MFSRKEEQVLESTQIDNLIGENLRLVGDVYFSGGLRIDGKIEGNVISNPEEKNLVVISAKGSVTGRITAHDAVVNGTISGGLVVRNFLELQPNARVTGNIRYRQLQIARGALVEGRLQQYSNSALADDEHHTQNGQGGHQDRDTILYSVQYSLKDADLKNAETTAGEHASREAEPSTPEHGTEHGAEQNEHGNESGTVPPVRLSATPY